MKFTASAVGIVLSVFALNACVSEKKNGPHHNVGKVSLFAEQPQDGQQNLTPDQLLSEVTQIENFFLDQNCSSVLVHLQELKDKNVNLYKLPPVALAGGLICDARAGMRDKARLKRAISTLNTLKLRYPVVNEAWFHTSLAGFYVALGDAKNASLEKDRTRDLVLSQKQDAIVSHPQPANPNEQSVEQILETARQLLNNDSPQQALAVLDTITTAKRTENVKVMRTEAINSLVSQLRYQVRSLFVRAMEQTGDAKHRTLVQCEKILRGIIQNYPDYSDMSSVQNNLKQVQRELDKQ